MALGILAGALLAVSDIVSTSLRNHVRARDLEVATLLARGKMAELEDHYQAKGFRDSEESDDGSFEEEGHPEIKWQLTVTPPKIEADPDAVLRALTGSPDGLAGLLPPPDEAPALAPFHQVLAGFLQIVLKDIGDKVKKGAREVSLTVAWPEGGGEEKFTVRTHLVVLNPGEGIQDVQPAPIQPPGPTAPGPTTPNQPTPPTSTPPGGTR